MDPQPLVSVCCATYNHEAYIRDALESFVTQKTNFPFEVLIHDDASIDKTADIVREYEAKYPHLIKAIYQTENQYSQKKSPSRDFLYPAAKGKYIAICEGDDFWTDPEKLQKQFDFMENNPEYSMCFHGANTIYEDSLQGYQIHKHVKERDYSLKQLYANWPIPTASLFFRAVYLNDLVACIMKYHWATDISVAMFMASRGKIHAFAAQMSTYRVTSRGMVMSTREKILVAAELQKRMAGAKQLHDEFGVRDASSRIYLDYLMATKRKYGKAEAWKKFWAADFRMQIRLVCEIFYSVKNKIKRFFNK